jgi:Flp pilus assembly protein TadG
MRTTRGRSESRKRRGATAVEFAVVAPILFLLVFGVIEFGRYVMLQQIAVTSTREGSRKAALGSTTSNAQVETVVRNYLAAGGVQSSVAMDPAKVNVAVSPAFNFDPTNPGSPGPPAPGTPIEVSVQMSFGELSWLPGDFFGLSNVNVTSSTTMERE